MAYSIFRAAELAFAQPSGGDQTRGVARLSDAMTNMRANVWRYPPGARGRRHAERVQEELFLVLAGTPTLLLGDPPERVELTAGSLAIVAPGTPIQVSNAGMEESMLLIVGAPPETGPADYFPDAV